MRRRKVTKRELTPDVKYNSPLVARLINTIMSRGKKSTAQSIVYGALDIIGERKKDMAPIEVDPERQVALAMRWITTYSRGRKGKSMMESLAGELLDAFANTGSAIKKKEDTFKMAQANKAFAHYRW